MRKLLDKTVLRFLLVGVVNTLVGAGLMFLLYNVANCSYWLSSAANYVVGGIVSFFLNKYFTFENKTWSWGAGLALCAECGDMLFHWLRPGQARRPVADAGLFHQSTGKCRHAGRHVPVYRPELSRPALLCV